MAECDDGSATLAWHGTERLGGDFNVTLCFSLGKPLILGVQWYKTRPA